MLQRGVSRVIRVRVSVALGLHLGLTVANVWQIQDNWKFIW